LYQTYGKIYKAHKFKEKCMAEEKAKKAWYKRWWAITLFIIIGISAIGNMLEDVETSTSLNPSPQEESEVQKITEAEEIIPPSKIAKKTIEAKVYSVGDTIQAGDFKWKIVRSSTATEIGEDLAGTFFGEKADGIFIIVDVEVENTGKSANYLMDSYLKLIDDQGREFSADSAAAFYLKPQGSALMFEQVNPGITKKGKIVFDVPVGLKVANMRISSNMVSSSFYNVKLLI